MIKTPFLRRAALFFPGALALAAAAAAGEPGRLRFAVTGCAHIGKCPAAGYAAAVERMKDYKPDLLLTLGGMSEAAPGAPSEKACAEAAEISARLGVRVLGVTGGCALSTAAPAGQGCAPGAPAGGRAVVDAGGAVFILLDSADEASLYAPEQLAFLKAALDGAGPGRRIFVAAHRAPWSYFEWRSGRRRAGPAGAPADEWMAKVHPLLRGRVSAVFGAGEHYALRGELDGVQYLLTGSPSCLSRPGSTAHHFLVVDADGPAVKARAVPAAGGPDGETPAEALPRSGFKFDPLSAAVDDFFLERPGIPSEEGRAANRAMVARLVGPRPGMQVLDLGAGNGFYTFDLAAALGGKGKVWATEIDRDRLAELSRRAAAAGLRGIVEPVLVSPEGLDPFYTRHVFDRIFVGGVYDQLPDPGAYFAALRPSLRPGSGRILLVVPNNKVTRPGFSRDELGDMRQVVKALRGGYAGMPGLDLGRQSLDFIRGGSEGDVPYEVRLDLLRQLSLLAKRRYFFPELAAWLAGPGDTEAEGVAKAVALAAPEDRALLYWLVETLKEQGAFRRDIPPAHERVAMHVLNNTMLRAVLGLSVGLDQAYFDFIRNYRYPGKEGIVTTMERAGYAFTRESDEDPPLYYLEFKVPEPPPPGGGRGDKI